MSSFGNLDSLDPLIVIAFLIFGVVLIILWILLPFIVLSIKKRINHQTILLEHIFRQLGGKIISKDGIKHYYTKEEFEKNLRQNKL